MNYQRLRSDWLAKNAVVAFVGVLLLGSALQSPTDHLTIFNRFEIPHAPDFVTAGFILALFALAVFLASASVINLLQPWALKISPAVQPYLDMFLLIAYLLGFLTNATKLLYNQRWAYVLLFGGFAFFLFLITRSILRTGHTENNMHTQSEEIY